MCIIVCEIGEDKGPSPDVMVCGFGHVGEGMFRVENENQIAVVGEILEGIRGGNPDFLQC